MGAANKIDYIEFQAADLLATRKFFEEVCGWKFTDYGPDYTAFEDGRIAGGFARGDQRAASASGSALIVLLSSAPGRSESACRRVWWESDGRDFPFPGGRRFHFTEPGGNELAFGGE